MESKRQRILARWKALELERQTWIEHWRDLTEQIRPRGSRFLATDRNDGSKKNGKIINSTPTFSARTLAAGMMSGITSPSRPWFKLSTDDQQLDETDSVKRYLVGVEDAIRGCLLRSNFYDCLHSVYSDLVLIGTAAMHIDEDSEKSIRCYVFPCGQYALACNEKGEVDTLFRELSMTVKQLVSKFGLSACSTQVQNLHREGRMDKWVECLHAVLPNDDFEPGKLGAKGKRFSSFWLEKTGEMDSLLSESGYEEFPCMAPRWFVTSEDVYGTSPAMDALGDCRALQSLEKRKGQLISKMADPPMSAPPDMRTQQASALPGAINYVTTGASFEPSYAPRADALAAVGGEIREHESRIKQAFYADLWLMLSQSSGPMTAREVSERREEKLLQLGTVLQRVSSDLLDPAISRVVAVLARAGKLPQTPDELVGRDFKVEYLNIMAQAQKLLGTTGLERLLAFTNGLAQAKPDVIDKIDYDQTVDEYSSALGVPPTTVRPDDEVVRIRASRQKAQAQQAKLAQAQQASETAQKLGSTPMDAENPNALTEMLRAVSAR